MQVQETSIPGVLILQFPVHRDERGFFQEAYRRDALREAGIDIDWPQDNLSVSARNVVRGLHYQIVRPQAKLVHVVHGAVFDVAVDIRKSSPTLGRHFEIELTAGDGTALYLPTGIAHGFVALAPMTTFFYKVSEPHYPPGERTILWNDPELCICWPIPPADAIVSEKDRRGVSLRSAEIFP